MMDGKPPSPSPASPPPAGPQRRERLADRIYGTLLEAIVSGGYEPGAKLPTELQLAEAYQVSRPVLREALLRLQTDGLVVTRQGAGTFVVRRPPKLIVELAPAADFAGFLRAFEVRASLEGAAARLAAERGTAEQKRAIAAPLDRMRAAVEGGTSASQHDFAFHRAVAVASRNVLFAEILDALQGPILNVMSVGLGVTREGSRARQQRVIDEHVQIYEAILAGEPASAETAMRYHLDLSRRRLIDRTRNP